MLLKVREDEMHVMALVLIERLTSLSPFEQQVRKRPEVNTFFPRQDMMLTHLEPPDCSSFEARL